MWCEIVGWVSEKAEVKSQMHTGAPDRASAATIATRVGSARAFSSSAVAFARRASTAIGIPQTPPRCRTGSSLVTIPGW